MDINDFQVDSSVSDRCIVSKAMLVFQNTKKPQTFTFQFNPSTLRLYAQGGDWKRAVGRVEPKEAHQVEFRDARIGVTLSFKAYFDAMVRTEAFLGDKYALYAWTNAGKAIATAVGKSGENTVRPIVEGLLGAVRNSNYRVVMFQWGQMRHIGNLDKVGCKYTMFSPKGEPVRAEVDFEITGGGVGNDGMTDIWKKRYDTIMENLFHKQL